MPSEELMPKKPRALKGSVALQTYSANKFLRLRWTWRSKDFKLALGYTESPINNRKAALVKAQIEQDIITEQFDPTLAKYKPARLETSPRRTLSLAEIFEGYTDFKRASGRVSEQTIATRFAATKSNIRRFKGDPLDEIGARDFIAELRSRQHPVTANQNLTMLKAALKWAVKNDLAASNPYEEILPLKTSLSDRRREDHFDLEEIGRFMDSIALMPKASHYRDYAYVLFYLGLRPAELIGLRWSDIDLKHRVITIKSSLVRPYDGGAARLRKGTKNGKTRRLDFSSKEGLCAIFDRRYQEQKPTDPGQLIFTSPKGKEIDDRNFANRAWNPVCKRAGLVDRDGKPRCPPYSARHGFGQRLSESGLDDRRGSQAMGNSPRTFIENYGHTNRPVILP
jgi:integrase